MNPEKCQCPQCASSPEGQCMHPIPRNAAGAKMSRGVCADCRRGVCKP